MLKREAKLLSPPPGMLLEDVSLLRIPLGARYVTVFPISGLIFMQIKAGLNYLTE
jgi:hypothetical protein